MQRPNAAPRPRFRMDGVVVDGGKACRDGGKACRDGVDGIKHREAADGWMVDGNRASRIEHRERMWISAWKNVDNLWISAWENVDNLRVYYC